MDTYEKKYKEAIERMKSWARGEHPECFTEAQKTAEFIFPELAESEDERIRKTIIRFFKDQYSNETEMYDGSVTVGKAIAWLEKQGEKSPEEQIEHWQRMRDIAEKMVKELLEKQGKQKPTFSERYENIAQSEWFKRTHEGMSVSDDEDNENDRIKKELIDAINGLWANDALPMPFSLRRKNNWIAWLEKQGKQKTEWSDEDEKYIDNCCLLIGAADDCYEKTFKDDCIHYLQSLKERIAWKPKWTDEDEKIALSIEQVMNCASLLNIIPEKIDKIRTWLKSLKQRIEEL